MATLQFEQIFIKQAGGLNLYHQKSVSIHTNVSKYIDKIQLTRACPYIVFELRTRDTLQWNHRGGTKLFACLLRVTP